MVGRWGQPHREGHQLKKPPAKSPDLSGNKFLIFEQFPPLIHTRRPAAMLMLRRKERSRTHAKSSKTNYCGTNPFSLRSPTDSRRLHSRKRTPAPILRGDFAERSQFRYDPIATTATYTRAIGPGRTPLPSAVATLLNSSFMAATLIARHHRHHHALTRRVVS
jgi:hypothetical protein